APSSAGLANLRSPCGEASRIELRNLCRLSLNQFAREDKLRAGRPRICQTTRAGKKALFNDVAKGPIADSDTLTHSVRIVQVHNATPLLASEASLGLTPARLPRGCLIAWRRNVDC